MKRVLLVTAALVAAVAVLALLSMPRGRLNLAPAWADGSVPGSLHIHSIRSDGRGSLDDIAAAASRAGLKFIILTDHGDATRTPEPPAYRSGVLCLDGVEISTSGGHYVAIDMATAPYPLGGEPRDVVDDVRRLGGFGIAAHPDSPKPELAWQGWAAPFDGLEVLNPDTSWRMHAYQGGWRPRFRLLEALASYPFRPSETIAGLLTRSMVLAEQWATFAAERRVVGLAGADAHAKIALVGDESDSRQYSLPLPGYESSFRAVSVHVTPSEPLTGDAALDAQRVVQGIRSGHLYLAVDSWASPPAFTFTATNRTGTGVAGDELTPGGDVSLRVHHNAPAGFVVTIWRGREPVVSGRSEHDFMLEVGAAPAVYRAEVIDPLRPDGPAWVTSNPIYVRINKGPPRVASRLRPTRSLALFDGRTRSGWTTESDSNSLVALDLLPLPKGPELRLRLGLSGGPPMGQFAGAAVETSAGVEAYDRVGFTIRAEQPMRLSVQIRADVKDAPPERWQRSVFVGTSDEEHLVGFDEMSPIGPTRTLRPPRASVRSLLFIADTTNTRPGQSNRLWMKDLRLESSAR